MLIKDLHGLIESKFLSREKGIHVVILKQQHKIK